MGHQKNIPLGAWLDLALLALIWGGTFLAVGLAIKEVGIFTVVAFRVAGGAILLWVYIIARGLPIPRDAGTWGALFLMGVLNNALPFTLITWGQSHIGAGLAAILNGSTAIFGVIVAALIFADERLSLRKSIGVALGFIGVATAMGLGHLAEFNVSSMAQLAILGASVSYALASAWARARLGHLEPQVAAAGMVGVSALIMGTLALWQDGVPSWDYAGSTWLALGYLAAMATAAAYLLYYRILHVAGSGNLMLVTLLIPPVAIILGVVVLGETLLPQAIGGFAILAVGLIILDGRLMRRRSRKNPT